MPPQPHARARIDPDLRDFTTSPRVALISAIALAVGTIGAFVSLALLRLIGLFTNPVVDRADGRLLGIVALSDLLKARVRNLEAERRRERVLEIKVRFPRLRGERRQRIA